MNLTMNPLITRLCLAFLAICGFSACATSSQKTSAVAKRMTVRTTAYTHTEPGGRNNAIGTRLHYGGKEFSAASDWSWMPLGTRFKMLDSGRIYIIEDYGSALVGRQTVDLYVPTRREMNRWGVRNVEIEILEWGSKAMSLKLLTPRSGRGHVARMCTQLRNQGVKPADFALTGTKP
jgi:3D (Asp-Asp-Asp) domain-containing protein